MSKQSPLKIGDKIFIKSGKYEDQRGILEAPTAKRGFYLCRITSVTPVVIVELELSQICRNSIIKNRYERP